MGKYVFTVSTYKAIKKAIIVNEGITVIAGENGSGKSTLSRMMYYMVNIMNEFAGYVYREALMKAIEVARPLQDVLIQVTDQIQMRRLIREKFDHLSESRNFDELYAHVQSMLNEYEPVLVNFFGMVKEPKKQERILSYLDVNASGTPDELAHACTEAADTKFLYIIQQAQENIDKRPKALLLEYLRTYGMDLQSFPIEGTQFTEDDVDLIVSESFSSPLGLHRAIYIDTPMAVNDNLNMSTRYWNNLMSLMNREAVEGSMEENLLRRKLRNILQGDILIEQDPFSARTKLCYKRFDNLEIDLVNVATGFKSFAYLLRLLTNGYLKRDTLLLIDEPEAHLHPQWIVEFANILVQLNKVLGVKVIITSHNPDMVSAIRTISEAEGVLDTTWFYLTEKADGYNYNYRNLGKEVSPIFKSFNIALSRIELYGAKNTCL